MKLRSGGDVGPALLGATDDEMRESVDTDGIVSMDDTETVSKSRPPEPEVTSTSRPAAEALSSPGAWSALPRASAGAGASVASTATPCGSGAAAVSADCNWSKWMRLVALLLALLAPDRNASDPYGGGAAATVDESDSSCGAGGRAPVDAPAAAVDRKSRVDIAAGRTGATMPHTLTRLSVETLRSSITAPAARAAAATAADSSRCPRSSGCGI